VLGYKLTFLSYIGLLGLTGIVVNNAIVLIDRLNERLKSGEAIETAVIGASRDRLRAVLLTTITTIGGLSTLLLETSLQAQFLVPMAITICFGLGITALLVLFLVPAVVGIGVDIKRTLGWIFRPSARVAPAE
jgi:multidrug efflux pump subunit AcrB